ncbi:MAG: hypothetical protein Sapg2KO_36400 [Saprospiraceae bacterium]
MKNLRATFFLIICLPTFLLSQAPKELESQAIIDRVRTTYANLPYYMDSTVVCRETKFMSLCNINYTTAFIRSDYFEIIGESRKPYHNALMKAGYYYEKTNQLSLAWIHRGEEPLELDTFAIDRGLVKLLGTGGPAAKFIAKLLLPDSLSVRHELEDYSRVYRQVDEFIEGAECYVLDLYFPTATIAAVSPVLNLIEAIPQSISTRQFKFWIRKSDFLIVKYDYQTSRNDIESKGTVRIFPQPVRAKKIEPRNFFISKGR